MKRRVTKAVFPVAGLGTRFLPATKSIPKEIMTLVDRPLIQYAIDEARAAGIKEFIFVTSRGKSALEDYFDHAPELESSLRKKGKKELLKTLKSTNMESGAIAYMRQHKALGLGHAVWCARRLIGNEPFAVILADDLCDCDEGAALSLMKKVYKKYRCSIIAIEEIPMDQTNKYGVIAGNLVDGKDDTYRVTDMVEKPDPKDAPTNMAIIGRYILPVNIFNEIKKLGPSEILVFNQDGSFFTKTYWSIKFQKNNPKISLTTK